MRSREDLVAMIQEVLSHPKADLLFELGLEKPNPTQTARAARDKGLSNEEEKLAKKIAIFKRDYGEGWFGALCEILENPEGENIEMGLTKTQRRALESIKPENIQEAKEILNRSISESVFDPGKIKREHLQNLVTICGSIQLRDEQSPEGSLLESIGMTFEEALKCIPDPEKGHENYLLVVNCLSLSKLMRYLIVNGVIGKNYLSENRIEDIVQIPKTLFYWRYDIEDGKATQGLKPTDAEEKFRSENRQGLTAREGVCLAIQNPAILKDHAIWCVGSRCEAEFCPFLWLSFGGRPELFCCWLDFAFGWWGAASARSV